MKGFGSLQDQSNSVKSLDSQRSGIEVSGSFGRHNSPFCKVKSSGVLGFRTLATGYMDVSALIDIMSGASSV